jgi:uncharacterized membrane protein YkoI
MRRLVPLVAALSLLAPSTASLLAAARGWAPVVAQAEVVPLPRVLRTIAERRPGRALDAEIRDQGGRRVYWVKWLARDGKVWEFVADARTGRILSAR